MDDPAAPATPRWRLFARPLWFCVWNVGFLALLSAALVGVALNVLGWQVGLPHLFWHETWWKRLASGISLGSYLATVAVICYLLSLRVKSIEEIATLLPRLRTRPEDAVLARFLVLTTGVALLVVTSLGPYRAPHYLTTFQTLWLPIGVALGNLIAIGGMVATRRWGLVLVYETAFADRVRALALRVPVLGHLLRWLRRGMPALSPAEQALHRAAVVFFLGQGLFFAACCLVSRTRYASWLPGAMVICIFASVVASLYGAVRWWFPATSFRVFGILLFAWIAVNGLRPYRHTLLDFKDEYARPVPLSPPSPLPLESTGLLSSPTVLAAWGRAQARGPAAAERPPLVVVAVDGGAIRAAVWAVSVLTAVERDVPAFPRMIRVITGASGGMVGAAYYTATLGPADPAHGTRDRATMLHEIGADSLEPVARRLVFFDLNPVPTRADRGYALETAWEANTRVLSQTLRDLRDGEREGWRPSLIISPMIVEDGRRLLISNLDLESVADIRADQNGRLGTTGLQAVELGRLVPHYEKMRVSTAVRLSASFPYVSPAAELPTTPSRRLVDAGYFEEHGVNLAVAWIRANRAAIARVASRVAVVQVPDQRTDPLLVPDVCAKSPLTLGMAELTSPLEGFKNGAFAQADFRNAAELAALQEDLAHDLPVKAFAFEPYDQVAVPECLQSADRAGWKACAERYCDAVRAHRPVALTWHMVEEDLGFLDRAASSASNCAVRASLAAWLTGGTAQVSDCPTGATAR